VTLDSVNNGTLLRGAARVLCGTVRVKQADRIRAARVSSEIQESCQGRLAGSASMDALPAATAHTNTRL